MNHSNNWRLTFHIVDSPMGIGKSVTLIDLVRFRGVYTYDPSLTPQQFARFREACKRERFIIFVSTIKERDERFLQELDAKCPERPPYNKSILELIRNGENIVTTQSLYGLFNEETLAAFRRCGFPYTAYFDEIPPLFRNVVGGLRNRITYSCVPRFGPSDVRLMQQANMVSMQDGTVRFDPKCEYSRGDKEYKVFDAVKNLSRSCTLYPFGSKDGFFTSILAFAKRELFACFKECWFFSYLTCDSMLHKYCLLNDITMKYYRIIGQRVIPNPDGKFMELYPEGMERLVILDGRQFNMDCSLSKEWYKRAMTEKSSAGLKLLKRRFRNAYEFMKQQGVRSDTFMFTVFDAYKDLVQSNGNYYPSLKRFLPCNTKATNDYSNCTGVAYLCNRFFDVTCTNFLAQRAQEENDPRLKFNNDNYALSELLQFIWRSNLRVKDSDKPVYVWVPDKRMRKLLQDFRDKALEYGKLHPPLSEEEEREAVLRQLEEMRGSK